MQNEGFYHHPPGRCAGSSRLRERDLRNNPPPHSFQASLTLPPLQCNLLTQSLGSKIALPGQPAYVQAGNAFWSLQETSIQPACILIPSSAQDVAQAVSVIASVAACEFAIKGRGHNPAAGFANVQGGVTIDMTPLSGVEVNEDHSVARVGPGATRLDVYQYLDPFNVSAAGGRNGAVGVGGLLLGGGISHFSPRVGWACDNVVNFEVSNPQSICPLPV